MRSESELRTRIAEIYEAEDRLDKLDWIGRQWVASYSANASIVADALLELLDGIADVPQCMFGIKETSPGREQSVAATTAVRGL